MSDPRKMTEQTYEGNVNSTPSYEIGEGAKVARALNNIAVQMFGMRADANRHISDAKEYGYNFIESAKEKIQQIMDKK